MVVAETTSYSCKKCLFLINLARFVIQLCNRIEFVGYQSRRHWNNFHEIAFVEGDHQQCLPDSWSFHSVILVHLCYSQRKQRNTAKICTLSQKVTRCIRSFKSAQVKWTRPSIFEWNWKRGVPLLLALLHNSDAAMTFSDLYDSVSVRNNNPNSSDAMIIESQTNDSRSIIEMHRSPSAPRVARLSQNSMHQNLQIRGNSDFLCSHIMTFLY